MITKTNVRFFLILSAFAFFFAIGGLSRPILAQCDNTTDAMLVADIYANIQNDKVLAAQIPHINVVSVNAVVSFTGWADTKRDRDRIIEFANNSCVRMVNPNNFAAAPPASSSSLRSANGCASGTKPCGDICIPEGDSCNITGGSKP